MVARLRRAPDLLLRARQQIERPQQILAREASRERLQAFALAARAVEMGYDLRAVCRELSRMVRDVLVLAVDPARIVALYFGVSGSRSTDYFRNLRGDGEQRRTAFLASGKHFIWRRGPNGFEGPYLEGESRVVGGY